MTQEKTKKLHLIYGCIATVLIIALGIALAVACWSIYQSGSRPFTRDAIGAKLQQISVLIYLVAAIIAGGFILHLVFPLAKPKTKAVRDELVTMQKLAAKVGETTQEVAVAIQKEYKLQKSCPLITGVVYALLMVYPAFYLLDKSHFAGIDPTGEIMKASMIVLPFAILGLVLCYICTTIVRKSILRQTAIYKQMIAAGNTKPSCTPSQEDKTFPLRVVRCIVFAAALALIILGIFNGSAEDVLTKAIKICTECIGLG